MSILTSSKAVKSDQVTIIRRSSRVTSSINAAKVVKMVKSMLKKASLSELRGYAALE